MAKGIKTGGRQAGSRNKKTKARREAMAASAAKIAVALGKDAFDGDSFDFLMGVYKDQKQPFDARIDAAKSCLPYERSRLVTTHTLQGPGGTSLLPAGNNNVLEEVKAMIEDEMKRAELGSPRRRPANSDLATAGD